MVTKITKSKVDRFRISLYEAEKSSGTIAKYMHDIHVLSEFVGSKPLTKALVVEYKERLAERFKPATVNSMLAAANSFLSFIGRSDCRVKPLKIQRSAFSPADRELRKEEYRKMIRAAERSGNQRSALIIQTICATGIRVSELKFITVEAVTEGAAYIRCKGKFRVVFLPKQLRRLLKNYAAKQKITAGAVFVTKYKKPLDRSNVWRMMKKIGENAHVPARKVFPHNLRHLFARTFYSRDKDIFRLADILGHSNVNTTRIYTAESGAVLRRRLDDLGLVFTT